LNALRQAGFLQVVLIPVTIATIVTGGKEALSVPGCGIWFSDRPHPLDRLRELREAVPTAQDDLEKFIRDQPLARPVLRSKKHLRLMTNRKLACLRPQRSRDDLPPEAA
jgi:hypothetical protein